jgi:hypothetical protein
VSWRRAVNEHRQLGDDLREYVAERDVACPSCGYNLRGLESSTCPECGCGLRLEVASDRAKVRKEAVSWLRIASSPPAIAGTVALGAGLALGPEAAAVIVLGWAGLMAMVCYWRWTRPFMTAPGLTTAGRERRGLLVTLTGILIAFLMLLLVLALADVR